MAPTKPAAEGRPKVPPKKIIDTIREATGASDEDIKSVLEECNNDVNEATARLIDSTFLSVRRLDCCDTFGPKHVHRGTLVGYI
jgi:hypothetical protein